MSGKEWAQAQMFNYFIPRDLDIHDVIRGAVGNHKHTSEVKTIRPGDAEFGNWRNSTGGTHEGD